MYYSKDFDNVAPNYRDTHNQSIKFTGAASSYFCEYKVKNSIRILGPSSNPVILDFGCGDGLACLFFNKYLPNAQLFGIDTSSESIHVASGKNIPNTKFCVFNGTSLSYPDLTFDLVYVSCVLHHIDSALYPNILKELYRVLKKGGIIHIYEHNPNNIFTQYAVSTCTFDEGVTLLNPRNLKKAVFSVGFENVNVDYIFFYPRWGFLKKIDGLEHLCSKVPLGAQYLLKGSKR